MAPTPCLVTPISREKNPPQKPPSPINPTEHSLRKQFAQTLSARLLFNLKERGRTVCTNSPENCLRKLFLLGWVVFGVGFLPLTIGLDICGAPSSRKKFVATFGVRFLFVGQCLRHTLSDTRCRKRFSCNFLRSPAKICRKMRTPDTGRHDSKQTSAEISDVQEPHRTGTVPSP